MRHVASSLLAVVVLAGCGDDTAAPIYDADPIDDLAVTVTSPHAVWLRWTAPEVVGGAAASYEIRYREGDFPAGDWVDATEVSDPPLPGTPDELQSCSVYGLPAGVTLTFRIRYERDGWYSGLSNAGDAAMPEGEPIPDGFAYVPAGSFTLGSPAGEAGREDDEEQRYVTLTGALFVGEHEITQAEYAAVMGSNPSLFLAEDRPVEQVSWHDAVAYCNARSVAEGLAPAYGIAGDVVTWDADAPGYRLPTEAEWEVACRAGTESAFCSGSINALGCTWDGTLAVVAVYCVTDVDDDDTEDGDEDGPDGPAEVGGLLPNGWGLRDMHGNVYEWCWDWYIDRFHATVEDPTGPSDGVARVIRGGCWTSPVEACRSAARSALSPASANYGIGFRVVRPAG